MSQFDRENNEVFTLVNENHRRSKITRTVGVIVPVEEAEQIAARNAREAQASPSVAGVVIPLLSLLAAVAAGVIILA